MTPNPKSPSMTEVLMEMESTTSPWTELYQAEMRPADLDGQSSSSAAEQPAQSRQADADADAKRATHDALSNIFNR